ncbi:hypothetical protein QNI19_18680 [Cytophagaceae bacterium DM2B3-1]|uniref:Lipoprotein n=1 Tax=Xanthocytophaga flava TaxID=3048013 RepID=A0ABT7CMK6_9BACT|nr:hypothetical protein [Xanthocytophaga flavus]MDJ1494971.1 hypothetical protein [Xanthocytophaga flavus]
MHCKGVYLFLIALGICLLAGSGCTDSNIAHTTKKEPQNKEIELDGIVYKIIHPEDNTIAAMNAKLGDSERKGLFANYYDKYCILSITNQLDSSIAVYANNKCLLIEQFTIYGPYIGRYKKAPEKEEKRKIYTENESLLIEYFGKFRGDQVYEIKKGEEKQFYLPYRSLHFYESQDSTYKALGIVNPPVNLEQRIDSIYIWDDYRIGTSRKHSIYPSYLMIGKLDSKDNLCLQRIRKPNRL